MVGAFESWKQKRVASKKTAQEELDVKKDDLETVEVPGEIQEVSVDEVPAEIPAPEAEIEETPEDGVSQISLKVTNVDDLELAKDAIKDALDDASIDFSFDVTTTTYDETPEEEKVEETEEEEVKVEEEPKEEEDEESEEPVNEVEAKCENFKKFSKEKEANRKSILNKRIEDMRKGTDYNEVMSRSSLAPRNKIAHQAASSLKKGGKYLMEDSVIEVLGVDSNNDMIEYYDGKKDRTISASLSEVEKKVTVAENARVVREKEKATK